MVQAVAEVRERLLRATSALEAAGVPYAIAGGNAVAFWVASVDEAATRVTPDLDLVIRRDDFPRAKTTLVEAGFVYQESSAVPTFFTSPEVSRHRVVHVYFAGEKVQPDYLVPAPDVAEAVAGDQFRVLTLEALVRMKLTSFRNKDRMHIRDLMDVSLIDATWPARFPHELGARLQQVLDDPKG
jgi:hypothetical protein